MEYVLYAQVVMFRQKNYDNKKLKLKEKMSSKGNLDDQYAGLMLIMSG